MACGLLLPAGAAPAAVGVGTSPPAILDTVAPELVLDPLPAHLLVQGGQSVTFHWTTFDGHPGTTADDFTAQVNDGTTPLATIDYLADFADATWVWEAPEISSGGLHAMVTCRDAFGNVSTARTDDFSVILSTSGAPLPGLPAHVVLEGARPNPCNPRAVVRFSLPAAGAVVLDLHDAGGARVRRLAAGTYDAGAHELVWDGRDDQGRDAASGTYLLRLGAGQAVRSAKVSLIR
ncbi:MAG: hypothetical protein IPK64_12730 [bacterium]|nr:hypothetical protein [bacterium]